MPSVEELIIAGKLPDGTQGQELESPVPAVRAAEPEEVAVSGVTDLSKDNYGNPIFADLEEQVVWDWNNLPSERIKQKKNSNPAYAEALVRMLNSPETVAVPPVAPVVAEVVETIAPVVAPVVATVEEVVDEDDPNLVKTANGWEYRIDFGDGSGVQVFKGKTQKQVISALGRAQANASKKIRAQQQENRLLIAQEPAEVEVPQSRLKPRELSADEQWSISQDLSDPAKAMKALDRYIEARLGGSISEVVEKITEHDNDLEYRRVRNEAIAFSRETPEFYNVQENREALANFIEEKGWANTKRNMNKAFVILTDEGKLIQNPSETVSTPVASEVSTTEVTETASATAPVVAVPPVTKPTPAAPTQPAGLPEGVRVRPGSGSTGMSPRQSSVRAGGATPSTPVGLTVEEYRRIPSSTVKLKYKTDPAFKAQVDKLINEGKI